MKTMDSIPLPSGMRQLADAGRTLSVYDLLARLGRGCGAVLVCNFNKLRLPLPPGIAADDDLYRDAPAEIRESHSLHFVAPEDIENWLELVEELRARGPLIILFTRKGRKELLEGLKPYLAWYADPGVLQVQFAEGSERLAQGLMTGVEALLLQTSIERGWRLYVPPGHRLPEEDDAPAG
jgi:hypothetical protein